ncbi:hypothetical protein SCLCIDRAFT_23478 [Scleroderma citrinum Foug A]|uniref:Uncharacterized protein n=1 Tax=Scleroderma citrinum Foug A TaxID=1036808 RepID=A0A0C2ZSF4_9AGAM|nr:hypothetical protein SCLCIDRAFT_23478 [Scleroderma citrinum Foug A]
MAIIALDREIDHLEKKHYKTAHNKAQALWFIKGEQVNKYWTRVNNPRTPHDLIYRLIHPNTQEVVTRSDKMSELVRDYHENLQKEGLLQPTTEPRLSAIHEVLDAIPETQKLNDPNLSPLDSVITYIALTSTLKLSKLGSAASGKTINAIDAID